MTGSENVSAEHSDSGGNITRSEQPFVVFERSRDAILEQRNRQFYAQTNARFAKIVTRLTVFDSDTYS